MRKIWAIYWYQNLKKAEVSWVVKKVIWSSTFKLADMVTFSSKVKKMVNYVSHLQEICETNDNDAYCFINSGNHIFSF